MNGFNYDPEKKIITITDNTTVVIWKNVEKEIALEAGKRYKELKSIDSYLHQNRCERFWGNKQQE